MTNKQAVKSIQGLKYCLRTCLPKDKAEALDMAIEALNFVSEHHQSNIETYAHDMGVSLEQAERELRVEELSCSEKPNDSDLISRQDAIDAFDEHLDYLQTLNKDENPKAESKWYGVNWARNTIADLPSAQPEPLTDTEQRIFLAAMGREREVCKQVDDEWRDCREPYEDSLVSVCNEIERKVKGALWTTV